MPYQAQYQRIAQLTIILTLYFGLASCGGTDKEPVEAPDTIVIDSAYEFIPVDQLTKQTDMPDPLLMFDGTEVDSPEQWQERRKEMIKILEDYEYGHMPPPPGNVEAHTLSGAETITTSGGLTATYKQVHITFGPDDSLGFDIGLFFPQSNNDSSTTKFPIWVNLTFGSGKSSLGSAERALARGYAVASIPFQQLGEDSPNYRNTAFFPAYPEYDWRDFSAWAWGLSRAVDYLVTDSQVDSDKIIITGVSRLAQAVLLAGAFDERIAMSAPVAGGMALRFSGREMGGGLGQGITEVVDQNTYWFGPLFETFRNRTPYLPCDQHWLLALTAPRLFIMSNALQDPYGRAYAAAQTYLHALPVYQFLEVEDNLGVYFREGGHGATGEDWAAILDFADQKLLGKPIDRDFNVLPPANKLP